MKKLETCLKNKSFTTYLRYHRYKKVHNMKEEENKILQLLNYTTVMKAILRVRRFIQSVWNKSFTYT